MIDGKKVIVVMPAYNAERTLENTVRDIPGDIVDEVILTDDCSTDRTVEIARGLGICDVILGSRIRTRDEALNRVMAKYVLQKAGIFNFHIFRPESGWLSLSSFPPVQEPAFPVSALFIISP